jgi:hypothetical protein
MRERVINEKAPATAGTVTLRWSGNVHINLVTIETKNIGIEARKHQTAVDLKGIDFVENSCNDCSLNFPDKNRVITSSKQHARSSIAVIVMLNTYPLHCELFSKELSRLKTKETANPASKALTVLTTSNCSSLKLSSSPMIFDGSNQVSERFFLPVESHRLVLVSTDISFPRVILGLTKDIFERKKKETAK